MTQPVDTKELRDTAVLMRGLYGVNIVGDKVSDLLSNAADELDALRAERDTLQQQLAEAKGALIAHDRMQNEQLAKHRDIEILALPDHIVASSDIVDDLCDHFYGLLCKQQQQLSEARERATEQYDLLQLATLNGWKFVPDWSDAATGRICMDVGHTVFSPPADDYSQAVKTAIKYVLDDGRDEIEDYNGIVAAIEAAKGEKK